MKFRDVLRDYLDEEGLRSILRKMELPEAGNRDELFRRIDSVLFKMPLLTYEGLKFQHELFKWIYEAMDEPSVKTILSNEGIVPVGTRQELFERLQFCFIDENEEGFE